MNRWISSTFDEFGRILGIDGLAPGEGGGLVLAIGERQLSFQVLDDAVVVILASRLPPGDALVLKCRALGLCHRRHGWSLPVRAGLSRDGRLAFLVRVPTRQFQLPVLEQAWELMNRLHQQVAA
jgi:type III secretion system chaperone SycN